MFDIGSSYWLKVKGDSTERIFSIKVKVLEENAFMIKGEVAHGDKPTTVDIIPFHLIIAVNKA